MTSPRRRSAAASRGPRPDAELAEAARPVPATDPKPEPEDPDLDKPLTDTGVDWAGKPDLFAREADERRDFVETLRAVAGIEDLRYEQLIQAVQSDGWFLQLREHSNAPVSDGCTLITFALVMGRDVANVQTVDWITVKAPANILQPSLWARANSYSSVVMALFNILPPTPVPAAQPGQPAPQQAPAAGSEDWEPLDLVDRRTVDGIPIFFDPYELTDPAEDILDSIKLALEAELPNISSVEGLTLLYTENERMFDYVKETEPELFEKLTSELLEPRFAELEALNAPPMTQERSGRRPSRR